MRKIPSAEENPIDNVLIGVCETVEPIFAAVPGMSPNAITLMSGTAAIVAVFHLQEHRLRPFLVYWVISYTLDCLDGLYAREHNMCTEFGSTLDHTKDVLSYILAIYTIHQTIRVTPLTYSLMAVFFGLSLIHLGTQEKVKKVKTKESSLAPLKSLAWDDIQTTKWFGTGTFVMAFLIAVTYSVRTYGWKTTAKQ